MGSDPMAKKFFRVTLSPRGVCSRIPHTMSRQCCITYHRKAHIIPFFVWPPPLLPSSRTFSPQPVRVSITITQNLSFHSPPPRHPYPINPTLSSNWHYCESLFRIGNNYYAFRRCDKVRALNGVRCDIHQP